MTLRKIDYLAWARAYMGRVRYDLARSNIKAVTKEELGLTLEDIELSGPHDDGCDELYDLIAGRYGVGRSNVFVCNGATQGIYLAFAAVLEKGDHVLCEFPSYEPLHRVPLRMGAEIAAFDRNPGRGFQIDLEEIERRASKTARILAMSNLHNPSMVATNAEKVSTLGQILRGVGGYVIVSEVYLDAAIRPGLKPAATLGSHLISLGSLSKVYGLGGVRGGWIVADEEVIRRVKLAADYISGGTSYPAEKIALVALKKAEALLERTRAITQPNFKVVSEWIARRPGLGWVPPDGGTVCLIRLPHGTDAMELCNLLRDKHSTLLVPGDFFGMRGHVRVSCGLDADVVRTGLKNLGAALDELRASKR